MERDVVRDSDDGLIGSDSVFSDVACYTEKLFLMQKLSAIGFISYRCCVRLGVNVNYY